MLCDNCEKKEANIKYSENINGIKKQWRLCEECSKKFGIMEMDFNIPINFASFFSGFMEDMLEPQFMPILNEIKELKCKNCGYTFDDITGNGKLGCSNCYEIFESRLNPIIKKIQGTDYHKGRIGNVLENKIIDNDKKEVKEKNKVEQLKKELKQAIKEERYEDAARIRDEIKKEEV